VKHEEKERKKRREESQSLGCRWAMKQTKREVASLVKFNNGG
jgi:hypothetical protein